MGGAKKSPVPSRPTRSSPRKGAQARKTIEAGGVPTPSEVTKRAAAAKKTSPAKPSARRTALEQPPLSAVSVTAQERTPVKEKPLTRKPSPKKATKSKSPAKKPATPNAITGRVTRSTATPTTVKAAKTKPAPKGSENKGPPGREASPIKTARVSQTSVALGDPDWTDSPVKRKSPARSLSLRRVSSAVHRAKSRSASPAKKAHSTASHTRSSSPAKSSRLSETATNALSAEVPGNRSATPSRVSRQSSPARANSREASVSHTLTSGPQALQHGLRTVADATEQRVRQGFDERRVALPGQSCPRKGARGLGFEHAAEQEIEYGECECTSCVWPYKC